MKPPLAIIASLFVFGGPPGARDPALAAEASAQAPTPQTTRPVRFELPNGLRVWMQEDHRRPVVLVQTSYSGVPNPMSRTSSDSAARWGEPLTASRRPRSL